MKKQYLFPLGALAGAFLLMQQHALADSKVYRDYEFDLSDISQVEIHGGIGSVEILPAKGDTIEISMEISGNAHGWFRRDRDVSDVELLSRVRGERLILDQTEDDTETIWTIRMPRLKSTSIELGVGEIKAELAATELDINLGVGDVDVLFPRDEAGYIDLRAGVGDARISGIRNIHSSRAFISKDISAEGDGSNDIDISVGVGDISLTLQ